jgi:hypothetical protein
MSPVQETRPLKHMQRAERVDLMRKDRLVKRDPDVALCRQVVNFVWFELDDPFYRPGRVCDIAVVQVNSLFELRILLFELSIRYRLIELERRTIPWTA